jgi:acylpyruvate hydrolase
MKIQNIWCVGRNFPAHAKELHNPIPSEPIFFLKAGSCITLPNEPIHLPSFSSQVEYELEMAFQFNSDLNIERGCLALDLTARDLQRQAQAQGLPWTLAKSFPGACPIGPFFPASVDLESLAFELLVNGSLRQRGAISDMVFKPKALIAFLKAHFPICPGDLILTGTPSGVSRAQAGDRIEARVSGGPTAHWIVV